MKKEKKYSIKRMPIMDTILFDIVSYGIIWVSSFFVYSRNQENE